MEIFAEWSVWGLQIQPVVALAAVAVIGYLVGRRGRSRWGNVVNPRARRDVKRARLVAHELEEIVKAVRKKLARHHSTVSRFRERLNQLAGENESIDTAELCREAEELLGPTVRLAEDIAHAYDEIRQQGSQLAAPAEQCTDLLTGVSSRRMLEDGLASLFALKNRYGLPFSVAMFDIDHFSAVNAEEGREGGDRVLQAIARLMDDAARETDIVTRYGGAKFVIVMPQTNLLGASTFGERLRRMIEEQVSLTVSGGVASARDGENSRVLLGRADQALHRAKRAGCNLVYRHDGARIEPAVIAEEESSSAAPPAVAQA